MKRITIALATLTLLTAGCASSGRMNQATGTNVLLSSNNYHVVKAGVEGSSSGFWLLFIPIASPNYADAKADVYRNVGMNLEGHSFALANETEDHSFFTLLLFSIPRLKVTADIIEFDETPPAAANARPAAPDMSGTSNAPSACKMVGNALYCNGVRQ